MTTTLSVDVWFDLVCPWCWIGKHNLAKAIDRLRQSDPGLHVQTTWHPVQLIPQVPQEGWPFDAFYEKRLGSREAVLARRAQVQAAARLAGAPIDYSRITVFPNTAAAHQLLSAGQAQLAPEAFDALLTRLFDGYFTQGENLGNAATLAAIAAAHGVDPHGATAVEEPDAQAAAHGVPFFVFDRALAVSGAQSADVLWAAMRQAASATAKP
ncbi:MAG: DsbA family oxidoreductase [Proteobacteria bacterium]|nr:DsbA family oxidoreductase [Pseudomonadota bacterium]